MCTTQVHSFQMKWTTCKVLTIKYIIYFHQCYLVCSIMQLQKLTNEILNVMQNKAARRARYTPLIQFCTAFAKKKIEIKINNERKNRRPTRLSSQNTHTHSYIVTIDKILLLLFVVNSIAERLFSIFLFTYEIGNPCTQKTYSRANFVNLPSMCACLCVWVCERCL